jgi:hypothetical protein
MPGQIIIDTRGFAGAMQDYLKTTRKDVADVLNDKAGDVALHAEKHTVRANYAKIVKKLKASGNVGRILKSGRRSRNKKVSHQTFQASAYVYGVLRYYRSTGMMPPWAFGIMPGKIARAGLRGGNLDAAARIFVSAKLSSIGYIATGWLMVAKFFGKPITAKVSNKGFAYHSTGKKATPDNLMAVLMNFSRDADKAPKITQAVQIAMDEVTNDLLAHITAKMQASAKKAGLAKTS